MLALLAPLVGAAAELLGAILRLVLEKVRRRFPWLELISADGGYNAWQVDAAVAKVPRLRLAIVKRSDDMKGFVVCHAVG